MVNEVFIDVSSLTKRFGQVVAVDNISFSVEKEKFLTLLGPSGCGKTTTLRCIGGLEKPDAGMIKIGGTVMNSTRDGVFVPPERRRLGMVFQSYAIWPHMTVFDNIAYGLKVRKEAKRDTETKVKEIMALVDLPGLESRYPSELSGGQQQRVALARSLVYQPKVLLLDEPLSNLDAKLREKARLWLVELQRKLGITCVYVTHDQAEALVISDTIVVMNNGKIMQTGIAREIYEKPENSFVADFIGKTNFLSGKIIQSQNEISEIHLEGVDLEKFYCSTARKLRENEEVIVSVRPENVELYVKKPIGKMNIMMGTVKRKVYLGTNFEYWIQVHEKELRVSSNVEVQEGKKVYLVIPKEQCTVIPQPS